MASQLRRATEAGRYRDALTLFAALRRPTGEQLFLAGRCHLALNETLRARLFFLQAAERGMLRARIDAATCLRYSGDLAGAWRELSTLPLEGQDALVVVLALRELAVVAEPLHGVEAAIPLAERAWSHAAGTSRSVQAAVAEVLAHLYAAAGKDLTARTYAELALEGAGPETTPYLHLARARSLTYLGRFEEADTALQMIHDRTCPDAPIRSPLAYQRGQWHRARGEDAQAAQSYRLAVSRARRGQQRDTECYAQLGLAALAVETGDIRSAQAALSRAEFLVGSLRARAFLLWRRGTLERLTQQHQAEGTLREAQYVFRQLGAVREDLWVALHLAETLLGRGQERGAEEVLTQAASTYHALDAEQDLHIELRALPQVLRWLQGVPAQALERALLHPRPLDGRTLQVLTLGRAELRVDGALVRLQRRRSLELLVYLMGRGETSLDQLRRELYPELSAARAKSELHLCRLDLRRHLPGLEVAYGREHGAYEVRPGPYSVVWDVRELERQLRGSAPLGEALARFRPLPFLPDLENDWVLGERERMTRWIIRVGLDTLDELCQKGNYHACLNLAERLLELEPLETGVHLFLVRATCDVHGVRAGLAACEQSAQTFEREVGEIPSELTRMRQAWQIGLSN